MTQLADVLDVENLEKMVAQGYVARKESGDGRILYDYTASAHWEGVWNVETRACRGLVTDWDGKILGRPFQKFHNLAEHDNPALPPIPAEPFEVFDKVDGSLVIAYRWRAGVGLNTRGSFASDQARNAYAWIEKNYPYLRIPRSQTWLFEWIAPDNRIVVDYGGRRELVLLAVIDNATGLDLPLPDEPAWPFARVERFDFDRIDQLPERDNTEGYVIRFRSGIRVKCKTAEYVRLHKILTGVSARTIWELLMAGDDLSAALEDVPDEFHRWVDSVQAELLSAFLYIEAEARDLFERLSPIAGDRKAFAEQAVKSEHRALLFAMLDHKPYDHIIWRQLKPAADRPFAEAEE